MNNFIKTTIMSSLLALLQVCLTYSAEGSGGFGGAFLRIPIGARPAGMGNAFVSIANDANSLYYNPGGLYQIENMTFAGMYSIMSMDRRHYQASFIYPHKQIGTLGLMYIGYSVNKIDGRDESGNPTGDFSDNEMAVSLSYGKEVMSFLGIGASIKYINHSLASYSASGLCYDIGTHFNLAVDHTIIDKVSFGIGISNIGGTLKWDTNSGHEDEIPATLRYGAGLNFGIGNTKFLAAIGETRTTDETAAINLGLETWIYDVLGLRIGLNGDYVNLGASLRYKKYQFDYALCPDILEEGATNKLALQIVF
ncbi:PorV/PorQ family protein [candidate division KSB1 bacterium]|nr:PorV/PorQ family protein [candidate division KSB1 bacterium]RQW05554.1 MAG: PorV/PorQ family protein [candidate division KSB1 bacterium]